MIPTHLAILAMFSLRGFRGIAANGNGLDGLDPDVI